MISSLPFNAGEIRRAPEYKGPGNMPDDGLVLDFTELERIAEDEREKGSFRLDPKDGLKKAPIIVPKESLGALVDVHEDNFSLRRIRKSEKNEIIVVLSGIVSVAFPKEIDQASGHMGYSVTLNKGDTLRLMGEEIGFKRVLPTVNLPEYETPSAITVFGACDPTLTNKNIL